MKPQLTRRSFARIASLAGAAAALCHGSRVVAGGPSYPGERGRDLLTAPVAVPHDFVGMHFHRWPQGTPLSPAPTYGYGTVRSHDYGVSWNQIHLAPQRYDWSRLDGWVQRHAADGKTLIYTVYGTPEWASTQPGRTDGYGHRGAGAPPKDLSALRDFVQALVSRYNTGGHRQIQFVEAWNEPHFLQNGRGFWWGTSSQMVDVTRTIFQTAKAADAGIKILSPAFDGLPSGHLSFTTQGIPAGLREYFQRNESQTPSQWFDGFSIHTYNADIVDGTHGLEGTLLQLRETLQRFGVSVPVYVTETGFTPDSQFEQASLEQKGTILRRQAAVQAALGVAILCFYSHDDAFCGDPAVNPPVASAINDVQTHLAGKTLQQVTVLPGGQIRVRTQTAAFTW